ncbi:sporulation protein YpjB [Aquibacillus koreensis]|uniref:Sporulation protein YpjB n=1 Tax=Aquibacillus koreensis TaxID=279446 RepID=A0A9X3WKL0_9BACI|nr:sporulation protein YpjB [Aquibacillus koreensis]MCT2537370.1 sporulation protein YpjB [Aquibacillus koreensis]MDC3418816.1 sporulation protein YpjB [Aquibacillus koreensis]
MEQKKHYIIISIFIIGILWSIESQFLHSTTVSAHHSDISQTIYQYDRYVTEERFQQAYTLLSNHEHELSTLFERLDDDVKSELNQLVTNNLNVVREQSFSNQYKSRQAQTLLLAVDAIENAKNPLWMTWKYRLQTTLNEYVEAEEVSKDQIDQVIEEWEIMKPALHVALEPDQFSELTASFQTLSEYDRLSGGSDELKTVFYQTQLIEKLSASSKGRLNFIWLLSVVGGCITVTLSYVTWKKYKGEKQNEQMTN